MQPERLTRQAERLNESLQLLDGGIERFESNRTIRIEWNRTDRIERIESIGSIPFGSIPFDSIRIVRFHRPKASNDSFNLSAWRVEPLWLHLTHYLSNTSD